MIDAALEFLTKNEIKDCFEQKGMLVIPCHMEDYEQMVAKCRKLLRDCGYNKSWKVNPHHYDNLKNEEEQTK